MTSDNRVPPSRGKKIKLLIAIFVVVCVNVCGMFVVQQVTYQKTLETQFCIAMNEASSRFEEYQKSGDSIDFLLGVSSVGVAAQMAPQLHKSNRAYTEHLKLRQLYEGLFSITSIENTEIIQQLIILCNMLKEDPNNLVGHNLVQAIVERNRQTQ